MTEIPLEWLGYLHMPAPIQSDEGRMMINSVVWAQHINGTDTQTATSLTYSNSHSYSTLTRDRESQHIVLWAKLHSSKDWPKPSKTERRQLNSHTNKRPCAGQRTRTWQRSFGQRKTENMTETSNIIGHFTTRRQDFRRQLWTSIFVRYYDVLWNTCKHSQSHGKYQKK